MVYVTASVQVKEGKLQGFIELFHTVAVQVRQEKGCVQYVAGVDLDMGVPIQALDKNMVTILEKWESLEALQNHLSTPHMLAYFEKEKEFTNGMTLKVFKEA